MRFIRQRMSALAGVADGLTALAGVSLEQLTDREVRDLLVECERQARRLGAATSRLTAALDDRGVARRQGLRDTAALLRRDLRVSAGDARARVAEGRAGLVHVQGARSAGDVSDRHARVIAEAVEELPADLRQRCAEELETELVRAARELDPARLAGYARQVLRRLDPAGVDRQERAHEQRRAASFIVNPDGTADLRAHLTPAGAAVVQAALLPLASPRPDDRDGRDERTAVQRLHDGLVEACRRLLSAQEIPGEGGVPATVIVTVPLAELEARVGSARSGMARTQYGGRLTVGELLKVAGEAHLIPVVVDGNGAPLAVGRSRRFATKAQTYALIARDRGCSFPECDHPPPWTQRHHIVPWADGGATDLTNLTLLCPYHHANFERLGWVCQMVRGWVEWVPPAHVDPLRRPVRNTAHDDPFEPAARVTCARWPDVVSSLPGTWA